MRSVVPNSTLKMPQLSHDIGRSRIRKRGLPHMISQLEDKRLCHCVARPDDVVSLLMVGLQLLLGPVALHDCRAIA